MRPKLKEESTEMDKMSVHMLNYYQDAEAHIDELEEVLKQNNCTHKGTTIAHGPGADKCTECNLTWEV